MQLGANNVFADTMSVSLPGPSAATFDVNGFTEVIGGLSGGAAGNLALPASSSLTVSMRILAVGITSRMVRVASMPLTRGIRTSISTTSGANSSDLVIASSPSSASATTSMPSSDSRTMLRPRRNSAWSSAIRTRIGSSSTLCSSATLSP